MSNINNGVKLYVESEIDGALIAVTAIFHSIPGANDYLATKNGTEGAVCCTEGDQLIFTASMTDEGFKP